MSGAEHSASLSMAPESSSNPLDANLSHMANAIRFLSADAVQAANSGHPGMPLGMADVATVLWREFLKFTPDDPQWPGRDRFILSNGHGSMLLYSLLHLTGFDLTMADLKNFRQLDSRTPGHPEYAHTAGVETTTGPLGQGFANAVGMALAQERMAAQFDAALFHNKTYVMVGDGCLMEGISHEAAEFAGHLKLKNLIVLWDDNKITIDGSLSLSSSTHMLQRFESYGFKTLSCDGHHFESIRHALTEAQTSDKPVFIACKTTIGKGSPSRAGLSKAHGEPLGAEDIQNMRAALNWPYAAFEIPGEIYAMWQEPADKGRLLYSRWLEAFNLSPQKEQLERVLSSMVTPAAIGQLHEIKELTAGDTPTVATRKASGTCLAALQPVLPELVSGSADLTPSNNTQTEGMTSLSAQHYGGSYVHYGIREHAMGALMNGMALYGGILPVGGTFLCFADYMKPAIRLAALMQKRVVYVFTHDSIGLGEDGPTHQPVEHLAMLRAVPNLHTFRPADQTETAEAWEWAIGHLHGPTALCLTRQNLPSVRNHFTEENLSAKGAYILYDSADDLPLQGLFIATGSEVHIALEAAQKLAQEGIMTRVVSMPCRELFFAQSAAYREQVLPSALSARLGIEAASPFGWGDLLGTQGKMLGVPRFGMSAPYQEIYQRMGITAENAATLMKNMIEKKGL